MIQFPFKKVVRTVSMLLPLGLLALLTATSCQSYVEEYADEHRTTPLTLFLQTAAPQYTRTYVGEVPEVGREDAIVSIKVWLFDSTTKEFLAATDQIVAGAVTMSVPQSFISSGHAADVYIIANGEAAGITTAAAATTEDVLEGLCIAADKFSAATPTTAVPEAGLPMSRIVRALEVTQDGQVKPELPTIKITRAVSKMRFAFARTEGHQGEVLGVVINTNMIAASEYIFPVDPATNPADYTDPFLGDLKCNIKTADGYENAVMTIGTTDGTGTALMANADIPEVFDEEDESVDPTIYTWTNWSEKNSTVTDKAQAYNTLMDTYTKSNVYLRESDKRIAGTVYYRLSANGAVKHQDFVMTDAQDFTRNHIWIVYGYFIGDKFNLIIQTIPWEDSMIELDYTNMVAWKDGGTPVWTPALDATNSGTETFKGADYTVIYTNGGDAPVCNFTLDGPAGWQWVAVLEPLTDDAEDFISFADGSAVASGAVGQSATLNFKIATTSTLVNHRALLRLFVRTPSGDISREVQSVKYIISRNS